MRNFLAGAALAGVICYCVGYGVGYKNAVENMFLRKIATAADTVRDGVNAVKEFPTEFGKKIDAVVEEVKSWFRFRRGENGEIILDESSPIWHDVDAALPPNEGT